MIVKIDGTSTEIVRVASEGTPAVKSGGPDTKKAPTDTTVAGSQQAMNARRYFDHVTEAIRDCSRFYLLGPDDVKVQFKKFLERTPDFAHRIVAVESVTRMTDKELTNRVSKYFRF